MNRPDRRDVIASATAAGLMAAAPRPGFAGVAAPANETTDALVCCTQYVIDAAQREAFETYCRQWMKIIPHCGGRLVGFFTPHEGTNNIALGVISVRSLADYERYERLIQADADAVAAQRLAREQRFILSESRWFSRRV